MADPETQCITGKGTQCRADQRIRPVDVPQTDQHAGADQQRQRGHDDAHQDQRVAERDQEDHGTGGGGIGRNPCGDAV